MPPQTLYVTFLLPNVQLTPSGGPKVVYEYANGLVDRGHRVTVVHLKERAVGFRPRLVAGARELRSRWRGRTLRRGAHWVSHDPRVEMVYLPDLTPAEAAAAVSAGRRPAVDLLDHVGAQLARRRRPGQAGAARPGLRGVVGARVRDRRSAPRADPQGRDLPLAAGPVARTRRAPVADLDGAERGRPSCVPSEDESGRADATGRLHDQPGPAQGSRRRGGGVDAGPCRSARSDLRRLRRRSPSRTPSGLDRVRAAPFAGVSRG